MASVRNGLRSAATRLRSLTMTARGAGRTKLHPAVAIGVRAAVSSQAAGRRLRGADDEEEDVIVAFEGKSCPGCGVIMQSRDASLPGFYRVPEVLLQRRQEELRLEDEDEASSSSPSSPLSLSRRRKQRVSFDEDGREEREEADADALRIDGDVLHASQASAGRLRRRRLRTRLRNLAPSEGDDGDEGASDSAVDDANDDEDTEEADPAEEETEPPVVVCARCYSLVHYGRVKSSEAEPLLPTFDVDTMVSRVLQSPNSRLRLRPPVFVVVVDMMDFDGSLLRGAMRLVQDFNDAGRSREPGAGLVLCVNKLDLLPASLNENRLREWIYARLAALGLRRPHKTCLVSAALGAGIRGLLSQLESLTSVHSDVYLIGSQNAGKSSLINAMALMTGGRTAVTVAEMPGTTITPVMLDSSAIVIPNRQQVRIFDTPGALHAHSVTSRLGLEENKDLLGRGRRFEPRTFRIGAGGSILASTLLQVDVVDCTAATFYLTLWVSPAVSVFMGKTERADVHRVNEAGKLLVPAPASSPARGDDDGDEDASRPRFVKTRIRVEGDDWGRSSEDIAIAGLGWVAVGLNGKATLDIGTHEGVSVTRRAALAPEYARAFNKPGFDRRAPNKSRRRKK